MEVLNFRLKKKATRQQAINWLVLNCDIWPVTEDEESNAIKFHGWQFIESLEGTIYFADCIERGITEVEFLSARKKLCA